MLSPSEMTRACLGRTCSKPAGQRTSVNPKGTSSAPRSAISRRRSEKGNHDESTSQEPQVWCLPISIDYHSPDYLEFHGRESNRHFRSDGSGPRRRFEDGDLGFRESRELLSDECHPEPRERLIGPRHLDLEPDNAVRFRNWCRLERYSHVRRICSIVQQLDRTREEWELHFKRRLDL